MKITIIILILLSVISCSEINDNNTISTIEKTNDLVFDINNKSTKSSLKDCFLQVPDSTVNGIIIVNAKSILSVLGKETLLNDEIKYRYLTKDKKEYLNLSIYPGSFNNQVSVFEVGYSKQILKEDNITESTIFQTEKGIKLGVSLQEITKRLGKCYKILNSTDSLLKIIYKIETPQKTKDDFLNRYNMPVYYAEYDFINNKLNRFEFGFEYP